MTTTVQLCVSTRIGEVMHARAEMKSQLTHEIGNHNVQQGRKEENGFNSALLRTNAPNTHTQKWQSKQGLPESVMLLGAGVRVRACHGAQCISVSLKSTTHKGHRQCAYLKGRRWMKSRTMSEPSCTSRTRWVQSCTNHTSHMTRTTRLLAQQTTSTSLNQPTQSQRIRETKQQAKLTSRVRRRRCRGRGG
jgi:hypothetical protein